MPLSSAPTTTTKGFFSLKSDNDNFASRLRVTEHSRKALVLAHGLEFRTGNSDDSITLPTQSISNDGLRRLQEDYASEIIAWATEGGDDDNSERRSRWFRIFRRSNKNKKILFEHMTSHFY